MVNDEKMKDVNENNVKEWILNNCERYNILIDESVGRFALSLIEGLLHHKYLPRYEGHQDNKKINKR